jgi:hypothetical protein
MFLFLGGGGDDLLFYFVSKQIIGANICHSTKTGNFYSSAAKALHSQRIVTNTTNFVTNFNVQLEKNLDFFSFSFRIHVLKNVI